MSAWPSCLPTALLLPLVLLSLLQLTAGAPKKELPSYIHVCKRNDPHVEDCVINSIEKLRPQLISGIPELKVPSIEPLIIPELVVAPNRGVRAVGHNVTCHGGSNYKIHGMRIEYNDTILRFIADVEFPLLTFASEYTVEGRILTLPLKGKGPLSANATDVRGEIEMVGKIVKHKDDQYLRFFESEIREKGLGDVHIRLENLFNGDKRLGDATNAAIAQNIDELKDLVANTAERTIAIFTLDAANSIIKDYTFDQLFPKE